MHMCAGVGCDAQLRHSRGRNAGQASALPAALAVSAALCVELPGHLTWLTRVPCSDAAAAEQHTPCDSSLPQQVACSMFVIDDIVQGRVADADGRRAGVLQEHFRGRRRRRGDGVRGGSGRTKPCESLAFCLPHCLSLSLSLPPPSLSLLFFFLLTLSHSIYFSLSISSFYLSFSAPLVSNCAACMVHWQ
jgi:hypothetical protein